MLEFRFCNGETMEFIPIDDFVPNQKDYFYSSSKRFDDIQF